MNCRPLTAKEVRALYARHLSRDFPPAERKPLAAILSLLRRGRYLCLGGFAGEELRAYAFFTRVPEGPCWLLDYYAVCQGGRGQGAGSAFWQQLPGQLDGCQGLLIEVEDPDTAPTAQEREMAEVFRNGGDFVRREALDEIVQWFREGDHTGEVKAVPRVEF